MAMETEIEVLRAGELEVRPADGLALAGGQVLTLSVREFHLLVALVRRAGGIVSRPDLYRAVWGAELRAGDRSIDVYVHKLRVKLEQAVPGTAWIHTHVGFGYRFDPAVSHAVHTDGTGG
ncbi:MAG TPA: helix-turn-helix domain-containing protein [Baekduia sp.]|nr:helix-turn-helix domain-containing protein [Baekduia sp.]